MARRNRFTIWVVLGTAALLIPAVLIVRLSADRDVAFLTGAILRDDPDPKQQRPVRNAKITIGSGAVSGASMSNEAGFFRLNLLPPAEIGQPVRLQIRHPEYADFDMTLAADKRVHVIRLKPTGVPGAAAPAVTVANVRVRYTLKYTEVLEVGNAVRAFEIPNRGNVPCENRPPCSPDGRWKASVRELSLDAGSGKEFRNVRVSCVAGPCPFTRIESNKSPRGGRTIAVAVRNWSDTVTYLVEAEVAQTIRGDTIRHSYPAIFGSSMNFTLPASAQGPSIEAELDGAAIVFPLGPRLALSWASCRLELGSDRTKLYRCELKPQYRFQ